MKLNDKQKNIARFLGIRAGYFLINFLAKTYRITRINGNYLDDMIDKGENFVVAFWHGSMIPGWYLHKNFNSAALVSKSKDGEVLYHILNKWGYKVVRGSSHVGGKEALEEMISLLKEKHTLVITPDGPRGPRHKMKAGAVIAAKKAGTPLILAGIYIKNKICLNSWDKFEFPLPFTKINVKYSEPIYIDKELDYDATSKLINNSELYLKKLQEEAEKID
ncbi:lysophospholipid acyltransferase family protein [Melioribacter sp. Ez-97]|uniref:lysophospholipid acyltransferase family protein n=1 Tax=Melioribacter sp. Ez-97 TaxID=3423434 RepID=UPI003EDA71C9